jgi:hypothetical protein
VKQEIDRVHALGASFHAVAEFNWTAWADWVAAGGGRDWHAAGVEFRRRMAAAGFDLFPGNSDTWLVQELPTSLVTDPTTRAHAVDAARGLWEGDGSVHKMGMTTRAEAGSHLPTPPDAILTTRKQALEEFLADSNFWSQIRNYVRWWTEELYEDPHDVCVAGSWVATRAHHLNEFLFHLPNLAEHGGAQSQVARDFFHRSFMPLETSAWNNAAYGDNAIPPAAWQTFNSLQVYATSTWALSHPVPGKRIGFVWTPTSSGPSDDAAIEAIAQGLGDAINGGYGQGPQDACLPNGDWSGCQCAVSGSAFQEGWEGYFNSW